MIGQKQLPTYFYEKKDPRKGGRPRKCDVLTAIKKRLEGYSLPQIGKMMGVHHTTVMYALQNFVRFFNTLPDVEAYEKAKAPILSAVELRLLNALADDEKIDKASLNNIAFALSQIDKANNLARGRPTEIQNVAQITANLKDIEEEEKRLIEEIDRLKVIEGEIVDEVAKKG